MYAYYVNLERSRKPTERTRQLVDPLPFQLLLVVSVSEHARVSFTHIAHESLYHLEAAARCGNIPTLFVCTSVADKNRLSIVVVHKHAAQCSGEWYECARRRVRTLEPNQFRQKCIQFC